LIYDKHQKTPILKYSFLDFTVQVMRICLQNGNGHTGGNNQVT